jgi:hypothetical protein
MMTDLGDDDEMVVRLPCHTEALSCTFNVSTVEAAFASKNCCPACGMAYDLPGPQPSGQMYAHLRRFDCDGHGERGRHERTLPPQKLSKLATELP